MAFDLRLLLGPESCVSCRRPGSSLCKPCRATVRPAQSLAPPGSVDRLLAAWAYEGAARAAVLALKLRGRRSAAEILGDAIYALVLRNGLAADVLSWVPARRRDIRVRGFDHARVIAERVAARSGLPALPLLDRVAAASDQAGLSAGARRANLEGVFTAKPCAGLRIAVVDDLVTTGATTRACGAALALGGAVTIEWLAACAAEIQPKPQYLGTIA